MALLGVLLLAALLRFPRLTQHDVIDDEALMAFRSVGWLDTWFGSMKSPFDLFDTEQWWQKLSFHDHPPLLFFVEHQFFRLLGPTELALRLPFALAGVAAVILVYWLGREIFPPRGAAWSAAVLAVANYAVWLSRVGFQEGLLIVWVLAALWFFLRSLSHPKWCLGVGAAVGLALLTKYSAVVLVPVIVGGYAVYRRSIFRSAYAYAGWLLSLLIISPVAVYNAMLFATRGHFDATLWAMLGQQHPDFWSDYHAYQSWSTLLQWLHWLPDGFGFGLVILAGAGFLLLTVRSYGARSVTTPHQRASRRTMISFAVGTAVFLSLAPARKQYAGLLVVPVALFAGYLLAALGQQRRGRLVAAALLSALAFQTANGQLRAYPTGPEGITYLPLRPTSYVYRQLDAYLDTVYAGQDPAPQTTADPQLRAYIRRRVKVQFGTEYPLVRSRPPFTVWDQRMDFAAIRWTMYRRDTYLYQPTIMTLKLAEDATMAGADHLEKVGFSDFRVILLEPALLARYGLPATDKDTSVAAHLRRALAASGVSPERTINALDGTPAFAVYRVAKISPFFAPWDAAANHGSSVR